MKLDSYMYREMIAVRVAQNVRIFNSVMSHILIMIFVMILQTAICYALKLLVTYFYVGSKRLAPFLNNLRLNRPHFRRMI